MSLFRNKLIAHRGLHYKKEVPENSLLAIQKAVENSYDIEFDITITSDGQIVVFHDEDLKRLCGTLAFIEEVSYSFLEKQKLYETDEKIPLFDEVLELVQGKIDLIIEIKKHKNIGFLEKSLVEKLSFYDGRYFICSFDKDILNWFRINEKEIKRGLIFETVPKRFEKFQKALFLYKYYKTKPDFVSLQYDLIESNIYTFCKKKGVDIVTWTINTKEKFENVNAKVDGVIFESEIF